MTDLKGKGKRQIQRKRERQRQRKLVARSLDLWKRPRLWKRKRIEPTIAAINKDIGHEIVLRE